MASIVSKKGKSVASETVTGTPTLVIVGPPGDPMLYNGDVQGLYMVTASNTYRWVHDERRPAHAGPRTGYAAR
jgi:hypothetical protein